jgi:valyl-tRNA synthetase
VRVAAGTRGGHRIPASCVGASGESDYIVARDENEARRKQLLLGTLRMSYYAKKKMSLIPGLVPGLWPFATVGWPQDEEKEFSDLARFYPSSCLETGIRYSIFLGCRMAMMGLELTRKSPFDTVYLHGLVRAADGTKMSKTKGNVLDPLDTVAKFGADSLRYSLVTGVTPGQDIPLNMEKIEANCNFANKLWNICKFVTGNALKDLSESDINELAVSGPIGREEFETLSLPEKYIVSKLHVLVGSITKDIESYQLGAAGSKIYEFLWDQYADWYVEISKTRIYEGAGGGGELEAKAARRVLVYVLDFSLRLLHPYMPFVTEQLWHHLPRAPKSDEQATHALMLADWPEMEGEVLVTDAAAVSAFECFQALTRSIRNARAEYNVEPGKRISAVIVAGGELSPNRKRAQIAGRAGQVGS